MRAPLAAAQKRGREREAPARLGLASRPTGRPRRGGSEARPPTTGEERKGREAPPATRRLERKAKAATMTRREEVRTSGGDT
uniref:Uncharacterized protein n=1 Tax=Oryza sativa subsp. japonica TaxID=39947 RepID=Q6K5M9_ORYSJ|nr:hypothetical protein [Oryza sativa Japonica Group]BAD22096.1 hypothetical protein [Oryza sativa Japonica Group]